MKRRLTTREIVSPGDVLVRAYRAANRGRFAAAGRLTLPSARRSMLKSARLMRDARKRLVAQTQGGTDVPHKADVLRIVAATKQFEDPNHCWKLSTRCGSLKSVAIARQRINGSKAVVTLRLTLNDGSVVMERESLALTLAGWRIG